MQDLKVSLIQADLFWEDIERNLEKFTRLMSEIPLETDLVVLPEMFTTGFTMNADSLAERMDGRSIQWLRQTAVDQTADIAASLVIRERGNFYNRLVWMHNDGSFESYDKRHLFRMAGEHETYSAGKERIVVQIKEWRICPLICYDLRFPVWSRNKGDLDALLYIANWPEQRRTAWRVLLRGRAVENQVYVVGVNRVGRDGRGISYAGDSVVVDPQGEVIGQAPEHQPSVVTVSLSFKELKDLRDKFRVQIDADPFEIK